MVGDAWIINNLVLEPEFAHGAGRDGKPGKDPGVPACPAAAPKLNK